MFSRGQAGAQNVGIQAAVQSTSRVKVNIGLPASSTLIKCALPGLGVERVHLRAGTTPRIRHPVTWGCIVRGQKLAQSWGPGESVLWLCVALRYHLVARSDDVFAATGGRVHPVHSLTRGDAAHCRSGVDM